MGKVNYKKQGKQNRAKGARFERKVRTDLESKGWIVARWSNNVEINEFVSHIAEGKYYLKTEKWYQGKLVPAKSTRFRSNTHGFPDFIAFKIRRRFYKINSDDMTQKQVNDLKKYIQTHPQDKDFLYNGWDIDVVPESEIIGIECKYNGYLKPEEKEKCSWLLENNIFSKILIASDGGKDPEDKRKRLIKYEEFIYD